MKVWATLSDTILPSRCASEQFLPYANLNTAPSFRPSEAIASMAAAAACRLRARGPLPIVSMKRKAKWARARTASGVSLGRLRNSSVTSRGTARNARREDFFHFGPHRHAIEIAVSRSGRRTPPTHSPGLSKGMRLTKELSGSWRSIWARNRRL